MNHGNLLNLLVESGDNVLEECLSMQCRKNATYTSADIQNQIITILGEHIIRKQIYQNVKKPHGLR